MDDLPSMLGLDPVTFALRRPKPWLWMAARSSSTSYKGNFTPETLQQVIITGEVPAEFVAHVTYFMDEVVMQVFLMAIEQAAMQTDTSISKIWRNIAILRNKINSHRYFPVA
jgi:hypothetical protein